MSSEPPRPEPRPRLTRLRHRARACALPSRPPQVAIVGFGAVQERPWVIEGRVEVRPVVNLTLAADHRVTDGRQGAQFLTHIRDWLSKPGEL